MGRRAYYLPEPPVMGCAPMTTPETPGTPYVMALQVYTDRRLALGVGGDASTWGRSMLARFLTELLVTRLDVSHVVLDKDTPLQDTTEISAFITELEAR
jgi:hypothetical protein